MRTWQNLYKLLATAGVDPRECFFTNAYVGLKEGDDPTGRFPGSGDAAFRRWCAGFLPDQVAVMPRASWLPWGWTRGCPGSRGS